MTGQRGLLKYCVMYDISSLKRHMHIMHPFFIWMEAAKVGTEPIEVRKIILITGCDCQIDSALPSNTYMQQIYSTVQSIKTILQT
jgi:hypothetical protein